ncbi:recombinase family protein [Micromonospora sp. NPDC007230]|uniref:recombinase family protein n=1 Tax=Micromonospora sp. NPDC007230 TaxID=3364237 RepID=UPI0036A91E28
MHVCVPDSASEPVRRQVQRWNTAPHWVVSNQIAHPPLVTEEQFVAVQAILDERTTMADRQLIGGLNPP